MFEEISGFECGVINDEWRKKPFKVFELSSGDVTPEEECANLYFPHYDENPNKYNLFSVFRTESQMFAVARHGVKCSHIKIRMKSTHY